MNFRLPSTLFGEPFIAKNYDRMLTNIAEKDGEFDITIELPGYNKEDIRIFLYDGELIVKANHSRNKEEKDDMGNVLLEERYVGTCSRSFHVGTAVKEDDLRVSFSNGILHISVPTEETTKQIRTRLIKIH